MYGEIEVEKRENKKIKPAFNFLLSAVQKVKWNPNLMNAAGPRLIRYNDVTQNIRDIDSINEVLTCLQA